jgi:glucose-6-phosphate isomerase
MINELYFSIDDEALKQRAFDAVSKERTQIGYYALPDADIKPYLRFAETLDKKIDTIAVIGIGGSSLGAKAVYEFLKPVVSLRRALLFFESTDPVALHRQLDGIDFNRTHFFVISKSGTTIETLAVFKYIYRLFSQNEHFTFVTNPNSPLERFAREIEAHVFHIPPNVGGRFSVLSSVGMLPLACVGIDIAALQKGARFVRNSFFNDGYLKRTLLTKALFYAKHHPQYHINCLFAYSESLKYFCEWYVQLWGESLGKRQRHSAFHVGLTPIGLIGPKDQHSFLQLIMEGTRDKTVTFIKIDDFNDTITIPKLSLPHLESLDILDGIAFEHLINLQCDAVTEALLDEGDIPIDTITLPKADAYHTGMLLFYYELLTSLVGELIDVNSYDQPGVEAGKRILKRKLTDA